MKYLLKSMQMARSTYYFELSKADQVAVRNHCLADEIKDIFSQHKGRYGVRRVYQELIKRSHKVNHKRVQRLMHTMGLAGKRPKEKYHSYKGEVGKVAENILDRDFSTTAPMQKWTTDVSQFGFSWGKCYLSPILDMNTNEIISYDLSQSANMEQIQRMLAGAFTKFPSVDGLIFHSDQGWQYQHVYFRQALKDHKIIQSMSRKGNCYDNCIMETFEPFPVSWTVKMKKKQKETQDILSYHTQAAGCSDKARAKASGGRQPIEECGRTGL